MSSTRIQLLPNSEEAWMDVWYYKQVSNLDDVKTSVQKGVELCLLNPQMIPSLKVVQVAVFKALHSKSNNTMKCRNVYSEILFNLHPGFNMRDAFKIFGADPSSGNTIILRFPFSSIPQVRLVFLKSTMYKIHNLKFMISFIQEITVETLVQGTLEPITNIGQDFDKQSAIALYNISPEEQSISSVEDSIVCRVAGKEFTRHLN